MRLLIALFCLALVVACAMPQAEYVAVVAIDNPESVTYIGATQCDVVEPWRAVKRVSLSLTDDQKRWVYFHEDRHVSQARAFGGCDKFAARYAADSLFRLEIEAQAYCAVFIAQRRAKVSLDPDLEGIVWRLMYGYRASWDRSTVLALLPCG